jgi:hypothetical protein
MTVDAAIRISAAFNRLRVDGWTTEVVAAMRGRSIRPVLLKGPAIARWLYPHDIERRLYADVDLMVSPAETEAAALLLCELGFVGLPQPPLDGHALHARPYWRERDGATVDLHTTLHGLEGVPRERVWRVISTATERMRVGELDVDVPAIPVRLVHLILHLGPGDGPGSQAWRDLERGISRASLSDWQTAMSVAEELGALNELWVRLRRLPEGVQLADRLGVPHRGSPRYRLQEALTNDHAPTSVLSMLGLTLLPDARSRLDYVRGKLLPGEQVLCQQSTLARRGHVRLAAALHVLHVAARLPSTLFAWLRYYRE